MKKEDDAETIDDLGPDPEVKSKFELTTIILATSFLVISISFFYLLSVKADTGFGFAQIIFSIIVTIFATLLFRWLKFFMTKSPYLGLIIGFIILGSAIYSLRLKFQGTYTNIFSIIISVIVLAYLFFSLYEAKTFNLNN